MHWGSIITYIISSFMIIIFNKIVLTIFEFHSVPFIIFCQSIFTMVVFLLYRSPIQKPGLGIIKVCILNIANIFYGISGAAIVNVAMFSALRRISILMTLFAQWFILKKVPSKGVIFAVLMMIFGALVAAADDLAFDPKGYIYIGINNVLTTGCQIETKRAISNDWTKTSILFWSAVLSFVVFGIQLIHFEPATFDAWDNDGFRIAFFFSICLGFVINWSSSWTIEMNDALTLSVAGSTKSAIMGIVVCAGLLYDSLVCIWWNFIGLQISAVASLCYVYATHTKETLQEEKKEEIIV